MLRIGRSAAVLLPLLAALQQAAAGQGTTAGGGGGGGNATAEEHCPPPTPLPLPPGTATAAGVAFFCLGNTTTPAVVVVANANATSNNSTSNNTLQEPPLTLPQVPPPLWGAARVGAGDSAWPQGGWVMAPPTAAGAAGTDVVVVGDAGLVEATQRSEGGLHWAWRRCVANDSFAVEATVAGSFPPIPSLSPPVPPPPPSSSLPPSSPPPASPVVPGLAPGARFGLMLRVGAADASAPFLALLGRPDDGAWAVFERRTRGARATRVTGWLLPEVNTTAGAVWQQPRLRMRRWDSSHAELGVSVDGGVSWVGGFSNVRFDPEGADLYWGFMVSFDVGAAGNLTQNGPLAVHFADVGVGAWCRDVPCNQGCTRSPDSWPDNPGRTTMVCECPDGGSGPQCTSAPGPAAPDYGPLIGGIVGAVLGCAAVVALVVFFARAVRRTSAAGVEKDDDGSGGDAAQPAHLLSPPGAEDKNAAAAAAAADAHHADSDYLAPPSPGTPTTGNRSLRVSFGNAADHHTALATVFTPSGDYGVVGGVDDDDEACGPKKKSAKLAEDDAAADPNNAVVTPTTTSPPTGTEYGEMPVSGATSGGSNTTPATPGSPFRVLDESELAELGFEDNSVASSEPSRQVSPKSRRRKMSMPPSPFAKSGATGVAGGGGDAGAGSGAAGGGGGGSGADESEDLMGSGEYAEADLGGADTADSEYGGLPEDDKGEYGGLPEGQEGAAGGAHEYADAEVVFERRTTGPGTTGNGVAAASAKQKKKKQDGEDEDEEEEEVTDEYGDVDDLTPAVEDSDADASSSSSSESISTSVSASTAASDGDDDDDDDEVPPPPPEQG